MARAGRQYMEPLSQQRYGVTSRDSRPARETIGVAGDGLNRLVAGSKFPPAHVRETAGDHHLTIGQEDWDLAGSDIDHASRRHALIGIACGTGG